MNLLITLLGVPGLMFSLINMMLAWVQWYSLKGLYLSVIKENKWFVFRLVTSRGSWPELEAEIMQIAYTLQFE